MEVKDIRNYRLIVPELIFLEVIRNHEKYNNHEAYQRRRRRRERLLSAANDSSAMTIGATVASLGRGRILSSARTQAGGCIGGNEEIGGVGCF